MVSCNCNELDNSCCFCCSHLPWSISNCMASRPWAIWRTHSASCSSVHGYLQLFSKHDSHLSHCKSFASWCGASQSSDCSSTDPKTYAKVALTIVIMMRMMIVIITMIILIITIMMKKNHQYTKRTKSKKLAVPIKRVQMCRVQRRSALGYWHILSWWQLTSCYIRYAYSLLTVSNEELPCAMIVQGHNIQVVQEVLCIVAHHFI